MAENSFVSVNLILKHIEYSLQTQKQNFVFYIETFMTCIKLFSFVSILFFIWTISTVTNLKHNLINLKYFEEDQEERKAFDTYFSNDIIW